MRPLLRRFGLTNQLLNRFGLDIPLPRRVPSGTTPAKSTEAESRLDSAEQDAAVTMERANHSADLAERLVAAMPSWEDLCGRRNGGESGP